MYGVLNSQQDKLQSDIQNSNESCTIVNLISCQSASFSSFKKWDFSWICLRFSVGSLSLTLLFSMTAISLVGWTAVCVSCYSCTFIILNRKIRSEIPIRNCIEYIFDHFKCVLSNIHSIPINIRFRPQPSHIYAHCLIWK